MAWSKVCLVHGVDSAGDWYADVSRPLEKYFDVVQVRYHDYEKLGKFKVASHGAGLIVAFVAVVYALVEGVRGLVVWPAVLVAAAGVIVSAWEARRRRKMTDEVGKQLGRAQEDDDTSTHVIAHSFGTLLLSRCFDAPPLALQQVILVGAILPRRFHWMDIWHRSNRANRPFQRIRNEFGAQDDVVRLAGWARLLTGDCGHSGVHGFLPHRKSAIAIHDVASQWGPCPNKDCRTAPVLHNHRITSYDHNAFFLSGLHAKLLWLPLLLGYDPAEYKEFRAACTRVEKLQGTTLRTLELRNEMNQLADRSWSWCTSPQGNTLRLALREMLFAHGNPMMKPEKEHLWDAILWTARFTYLGYVGQNDEDHGYADPLDAMERAVDRTLAEP